MMSVHPDRRIPILPFLFGFALQSAGGRQWSPEEAGAWSRERPWPVGCNFTPSSAINQLEMWQPETFDPATIDRELGWAGQLGFNSVRVFLHHLLWQQDSVGFLKRMDQFLAIADKYHIAVMFVPFDGCWDPCPKLGAQRAPRKGVHNSGWLQSPGAGILGNPARYDELKPYIQGVIGHFKDDRRVMCWDLFNEPDNDNHGSYPAQEIPNKAARVLELLKKTIAWAREVNPSQPLTTDVWIGTWPDPAKFSALENFIFANSDIITFHNYGKLEEIQQCVQHLKRFNRPIICTEFMARPTGSTFSPVLGYLKAQNVGGMCWGFVDGKTQTIYPWDSWTKTYDNEPPVWFHDILRRDGVPFDCAEASYLRALTRSQRPASAETRFLVPARAN